MDACFYTRSPPVDANMLSPTPTREHLTRTLTHPRAREQTQERLEDELQKAQREVDRYKMLFDETNKVIVCVCVCVCVFVWIFVYLSTCMS